MEMVLNHGSDNVYLVITTQSHHRSPQPYYHKVHIRKCISEKVIILK